MTLVIIWVSLPEDKSVSQLRNILCFPLPVCSHLIPTSSSGMLDLKNIDIAVGIPLISCLWAQRHAIEVERSPSWICPLPVRSYSIKWWAVFKIHVFKILFKIHWSILYLYFKYISGAIFSWEFQIHLEYLKCMYLKYFQSISSKYFL